MSALGKFQSRGHWRHVEGSRRHYVALRIAAAVALIGGCGSDSDGSADTGADSGPQSASSDGPSTSGATLPVDDTMGPKADIGIDPPAACEPYCEALEECLGQSLPDCLVACDQTHAANTQEDAPCLSDYEALLSCVAGLGCDDVAAYSQMAGAGYPCEAEDDAVTLSCELGGVDPPMTCDGYCGVLTMCSDLTLEQCEGFCGAGFEEFEAVGQACVDAQTDHFDCVAGLDCAGYDAYDTGEGDYPCRAELTAAEEACA